MPKSLICSMNKCDTCMLSPDLNMGIRFPLHNGCHCGSKGYHSHSNECFGTFSVGYGTDSQHNFHMGSDILLEGRGLKNT